MDRLLLNEDDFFVFAGKVYRRPASTSNGDWVGRLARWVSKTVLGRSVAQDEKFIGPLALAVAGVGIVAVVMISSEVLPSVWNSLFASQGVPKWLQNAEPNSKTQGEDKAESRRASIAGQLKSISAVMSAERASKPKQSPTISKSLSQGSKFAKTVQDALVLLRSLVDSEALRYSYQVSKALKSLEEEMNKGAAMSMEDTRSLGQELATLIEVAHSRAAFPMQTYGQFCQLHQMLLTMNEQYLETSQTPLIANSVKESIDRAMSEEPSVQLGQVASDVQDILQLKPSQIIHRLVSVSVSLNSIPSENPNIERARELLIDLSAIADELVATKVLLKVIESIREVDALVEGHKLKEQVFQLRTAGIKLWPQALNDPQSKFSPSSVGNSSFRKLLSLHVLVRREQFRRNLSQQVSMQDLARWKHLVNAAEEISSLAFSSPSELQFGPSVTRFIEQLNSLIGFITQRNLSFGHQPVGKSDSLSYDNLILDATFSENKSEVTTMKAIEILRSIEQKAEEGMEVETFAPTVQAIHTHITLAVEKILPGGCVAISIGSSVGGKVLASCGSPTDADVVLCFLLGTANQACKQLTFVRTSVSSQLTEALFHQLESLDLSKLSHKKLPELDKQDADILQQHDAVLKNLSELQYVSLASLPSSVQEKIELVDTHAEQSELRKILSTELNLSEIENLSLIVDPLVLRPDSNSNARYMRVLLSSDSQALLFFLLPRLVAVAASSSTITHSITHSLTKR